MATTDGRPADTGASKPFTPDMAQDSYPTAPDPREFADAHRKAMESAMTEEQITELQELIGAVLASARATGRAASETPDLHVGYLERAAAILAVRATP